MEVIGYIEKFVGIVRDKICFGGKMFFDGILLKFFVIYFVSLIMLFVEEVVVDDVYIFWDCKIFIK